MHRPEFWQLSCNGIGALAWLKTVRNGFLPTFQNSLLSNIREICKQALHSKERNKCMQKNKKGNIPNPCQESLLWENHANFSQKTCPELATVYLCAAQPRVLRLDFGGAAVMAASPYICPLTFLLLRCSPQRPSSGPAPSVSKLATTQPTRLSR